MNTEEEKLVEQLFEQALDIAQEQRAAFLERHCGGNAQVRTKVERLLHLDCEGVQTGFRTPVYASSGEVLPDTSADVPKRIGRYEVVRKITDGGMGTVFEARQDHPRRTVAVKVIRPGLTSHSLLKRFKQEGDVLGQLQHPGIAHIYEAGTARIRMRGDTGSGLAARQPFFAMEYIRGVALPTYAADHQLDTQQRLKLFAKVCDAVQHAHAHGVIHRDLKPGNILVDDSGQPKILDFGVARLTDADIQIVTLQTDVGQLIGTVGYMSPEQVAGDSSVDPRSDVYALGVVLYELLAGKLPHDIRGYSIPEAARIIKEDDPSHLSTIDTAFRGDVETIVAKALEKDKDRRYQSAKELASDIRRYLADQPIVARPASTMYQLRKFTKRNKALVGGVTATVFTLFVGLTVAAVLALYALEQRDQASANAEQATRIAYGAQMAAAAAALGQHDVVGARRHLTEAPESLRGWEWQHFNSRLDESVVVIQQDYHYTIAFSADGSAIRTAVKPIDGQWVLNTFDAADGTLRHRRLIDSPVDFGMASGQDVIVFADRDHRLLRLDADSGERLGHFGGRVLHREKPLYLHFGNLSRDGQWVILTDDRTLALLDAGQQALRILLEDAPEPPEEPVLSADGALLAHEMGTQLWLWDADEGRMLWRTKPDTEAFSGIAISPDNTRVATAGSDGVLRLWDAATGEPADWKLAHGHADGLAVVTYSPDGSVIATAGQDRTIRLWDASTGRTVGVLQGHTARIKSLAFSPDGSTLASGSIYDHTIRVWDVSASNTRVLRHDMFVNPVTISPDGARIASGDWDGFVRLWDAQSGAAIAALPSPSPHHSIVRDVAFSPDGAYLAAAQQTWDKYTPSGQGAVWIMVYDASTGTALARIAVDKWVLTVAFDPRGRFFAAALDPLGLKLWELESFDEVHHSNIAGRTLAYSPDGRMIAARGEGDSILLLDSETLEPLSRMAGHDATVRALAFSPDGARLASASRDHTVRVWDVAGGTLLGTLEGHSDRVFSVDFSPEGARLASGSNDRTIRIWDTETLDEVAQLTGHTDNVWSVVWSPDSRWLVSGSGDYTARIWEMNLLRFRLKARDARRKMLLEIEPLVDQLYARLEDPSQVVQSLRENPILDARFREISLQVALREAVKRRKP